MFNALYSIEVDLIIKPRVETTKLDQDQYPIELNGILVLMTTLIIECPLLDGHYWMVIIERFHDNNMVNSY